MHVTFMPLHFFPVENVVFCRPSPLQLSLYKHLLDSHLVKSCLLHSYPASDHASFPPHLLCIGALKKLCNCPSLIHTAATQQGEGLWSEEEGGALEGEDGAKEFDVSLRVYDSC